MMKIKHTLAALAALCITVTALPFRATSAENSEAPGGSIVYGDADGDGDVTVNDAITVMCYASDSASNTLTDEQLKAADVYQPGDGVTASDAVSIQKYLARMILSLPDVIPEPQFSSIRLGDNLSIQESDSFSPDDAFINAQMNFAVDIFQRTYASNGEAENTLVSPTSIMLALAMTANGADTETLAEMENVLGSGMSIGDLNKYLLGYVRSLPDEDNCRLSIANSLWFNKNSSYVVRDDFIQNAINYYDAQMYESVSDSDAVNDINKWVNYNTDGMIENILSDVNPDWIMYLINAVAFDAELQCMYDDECVDPYNFTAADGSVQISEMMSGRANLHYELDNAVGFKKDYAGGGYSFAAFLPDENVSIDEFICSLDASEIRKSLENPIYGTVYTGLPKFKYEYAASLNDELCDMGMKKAFDDADFSRMFDYSNGINDAYISNVGHKTFISVDQRGTRAGAVTFVELAGNALEPYPPMEIILDRPFVYMIIDNSTNLPIFIGALTSIE